MIVRVELSIMSDYIICYTPRRYLMKMFVIM